MIEKVKASHVLSSRVWYDRTCSGGGSGGEEGEHWLMAIKGKRKLETSWFIYAGVSQGSEG